MLDAAGVDWKLLTRQRWSNCTVVGFSRMFRHHKSDLSSFLAYAGAKSSSNGGLSLPPIRGNSLYTSPASRPATNAPMHRKHRELAIAPSPHKKNALYAPDKAVTKTSAVNAIDLRKNVLTKGFANTFS